MTPFFINCVVLSVLTVGLALDLSRTRLVDQVKSGSSKKVGFGSARSVNRTEKIGLPDQFGEKSRIGGSGQ